MKNHKKIIIISVAIIVSTGLGVFGALYYKTARPIEVSYEKYDHKVDQPVTIELNQAMVGIDTDNIAVSPKVEGVWEYEPGTLIKNAKATFTPRDYFTADTEYTVQFPEAERTLLGEKTVPTVAFKTQAAPDVAEAGFKLRRDGDIVAVDVGFDVSLVSKNNKLRRLELRSEPSIDFSYKEHDDMHYIWQPKAILEHSKQYILTLVDTKNNQTLFKRRIKTADAPAVKTPVKSDDFTDTDVARIEFNQPIDDASRDKVVFDVKGAGAWKSDTVYEFTPEKIAPGTRYTYTVKQGLRTKQGGILDKDITQSFMSRGAVTVVGMGPYGNGKSQAQQDIYFRFSQPVDKKAAESKISVSSGTIVQKYWKGTTLYATVKNLGYQRTVSAQIGAGIKNTSFGLPTARVYGLSFTTEARVVKHNVPYFRQQHPATCTAATSRMVLAWKGIGTDEISLVHRMGYAPRSMDTSKDPHEWDDPMEMFVGDINGRTIEHAAGPDAPPVAKAIRSYGVNASVVNGASAGWIAQQIHAGRTVIMFGATRPTGTVSWKTPSGRTATMNRSSHVTVVYGVKGEPNRPLGFYVHDPYGYSSYWSAGAVATNIARDPYRQAIVVY